MKQPDYGYIEYIYTRLLEDMVSVDVPRYLLKTIFKYFREYLFYELLEGHTVTVKGLGKFRLHKKRLYPGSVPEGRFAPGKNPDYQYHVKFAVSPNLKIRLREVKGTTTLAEDKTLKEKRQYIQEKWRSREAYMKTKGGEHLKQLEHIKNDYKQKRAKIRKLREELELSKLAQQSEL